MSTLTVRQNTIAAWKRFAALNAQGIHEDQVKVLQ